MANSQSKQTLALLRSICKRHPQLRPPRSFRNAIDVGCKSADERLDHAEVARCCGTNNACRTMTRMRLHYELMLQLVGVSKSWAVSRGRAWCLARSAFRPHRISLPRSASRRRPPRRSFGLHWFREEQRLGGPRCSCWLWWASGSGHERVRGSSRRCAQFVTDAANPKAPIANSYATFGPWLLRQFTPRFDRPVGPKPSVGTKFGTSWTRAATTAHASRWISLPVRRSQYYAHRALPACLCHLCSPHRRHCDSAPRPRKVARPAETVEGFPIRRSVTRARGRCKRCGSSLITRAHRGAPRERLRVCKQDVFKDKPARRRLEICAIQ